MHVRRRVLTAWSVRETHHNSTTGEATRHPSIFCGYGREQTRRSPFLPELPGFERDISSLSSVDVSRAIRYLVRAARSACFAVLRLGHVSRSIIFRPIVWIPKRRLLRLWERMIVVRFQEAYDSFSRAGRSTDRQTDIGGESRCVIAIWDRVFVSGRLRFLVLLSVVISLPPSFPRHFDPSGL